MKRCHQLTLTLSGFNIYFIYCVKLSPLFDATSYGEIKIVIIVFILLTYFSVNGHSIAFGVLLVHGMFSMYLQDNGTDVYGSRDGEFEGI